MVPTFTSQSFDRVGAQLCPCNIATATPQTFTVASRSATSTNPRSHRAQQYCAGVRCYAAPIRQVRAAGFLEELSDAGSSRTPFCLASQTRTIRRYWSVPSGLLPAQTPRSRRFRLPQVQHVRCDEHEAVSFHHRTIRKAPRGAPGQQPRERRPRIQPCEPESRSARPARSVAIWGLDAIEHLPLPRRRLHGSDL